MIIKDFPQLLDVAVFEHGARAAKAVARLDLEYADGTIGHGTGFLIAPTMALTAYHNLFRSSDLRGLRKVTLRFDYAAGPDGTPLASVERGGDIDSVIGSAAANWALIRLDQPAPGGFPSLALDAATPTRVGNSAYIIQHPNAELKKVALGIRAITYVDDYRLRYAADTMPGSAGAPVFNDAWQVIAMHLSSNTSERTNEGVRIKTILRDLAGFPIVVDELAIVPEGPSYDGINQPPRRQSLDPRPLIYLCACPADQRIAERLEIYLAPLARAGKAVVWHRGKVPPGANVTDIATRELRRAQVVLVLLSAEYFESADSVTEGDEALALSKARGTKVVPIIARPSMWDMTQFHSLQPLPRDGLPLIRTTEAEEAFVNVARAIGAILLEGGF